ERPHSVPGHVGKWRALLPYQQREHPSRLAGGGAFSLRSRDESWQHYRWIFQRTAARQAKQPSRRHGGEESIHVHPIAHQQWEYHASATEEFRLGVSEATIGG